jgi:hypothetical protein
LHSDRVGLFILTEDKKSMILKVWINARWNISTLISGVYVCEKVSERSKGLQLPLRGLAGEVIRSNTPLNIADAYQDSRWWMTSNNSVDEVQNGLFHLLRFDPTMDRRTGYRTRQVLTLPHCILTIKVAVCHNFMTNAIIGAWCACPASSHRWSDRNFTSE